MSYYLLSGLTLGFSAAFTPGPFQAFLLNQATHFGWRKTLLTAFAPLISDGPIIILMVFVLSKTPDYLLNGLFIAGGLFLIFLANEAFKSFKAFEGTKEGDPALPRSLPRRLVQAALINALSPGPWIFWSLIAAPIFLDGWRQSPISGLIFMGGFYGLLIGGNIFFITLFASARRLGNRLNRAFIGISALALLLFGLFQLGRGLVNLL